jgi:hypothetical protein
MVAVAARLGDRDGVAVDLGDPRTTVGNTTTMAVTVWLPSLAFLWRNWMESPTARSPRAIGRRPW